MPADLTYVQSGQKFTPKASDWNAFIDAARVTLKPSWTAGDSKPFEAPWFPFCKLASTCATGDFGSPATTTVNIWRQDPSSSGLIVSTDSAELGVSAISFYTLATTAPIGTKGQLAWGVAGWYFIWLDWC